MSKVHKKFKKELIPDTCEIPDCGYGIFVTRHRIKPGRQGGKYIPGNVVGLCPNHHVEAELGIIPQYILFGIVQDRLKRTLKSKENNTNGHSFRARATEISDERATSIAYAPSQA